MEKKTFSYIFIAGFGILTFYLFKNDILIANTIANDGVEGILWYFISNVPYILLMISLIVFNKDVGAIKNIAGGLMIIYAMDILSYPRLLSSGITKEIGLLASSDGLVMGELLSFGLEYSTAHTIYYLVLPIVLVLVSLSILGFSDFAKTIIKGKG